MALGSNPQLTHVLNRVFAADATSRAELAELVYGELHRIAVAALAGPARNATIEPTGLLHEAWVRLAGGTASFEHRRQFFAFAARVMHSVLVDQARARASLKRGGDRGRITLAGEPAEWSSPAGKVDFLDLHEALERLKAMDAELHRLVELRFFSGLQHEEIAELLDVSLSTVERRWRLARAWLRGELVDEG